jgi:hypothetical protein
MSSACRVRPATTSYRAARRRVIRTCQGRPKTDPANAVAILFGPKDDGTYVVEFRTAGETLAISIPRTEAAVTRHFQERMPYGLFVPDVDAGAI